jgi:protease IV
MSDAPRSAGQEPSNTFVPAQIVPEASATRPRRGFSWGHLFFALVVLALFGSMFLNLVLAALVGAGLMESDHKVQERFVSHQKLAANKVAVISIEGVILGEEDGFVKRQIDRAIEDENVRAVVLRVNSPGGSISGSDYLLNHLRRLTATSRDCETLPLVVSMGGIAASGGYYVSMAVGDTPDTIFAEPTTFTGSIGVIIPHYSVAEFMEEHGLVDDSIVSKPLKKMGSMTQPMTDQERAIFQQLVDDGFEQFKKVIRSGRPRYRKDPDELNRLATGQIYTAEQARRNGLVDRIGFLEDAVDRAIELAGLDAKNVKVVKYKREPSLSSVLFGAEARRQAPLDLQAILDVTTPRAYYLCTWLPGCPAESGR